MSNWNDEINLIINWNMLRMSEMNMETKKNSRRMPGVSFYSHVGVELNRQKCYGITL